MKWESLKNNGIMLTISIVAEGFTQDPHRPHDPVACVEMTSSLLSHGQSSKDLTS